LAWTTGNDVRPLIDGRAYFAALLPAIRAMNTGDLLMFTGRHPTARARRRLDPGPLMTVVDGAHSPSSPARTDRLVQCFARCRPAVSTAAGRDHSRLNQRLPSRSRGLTSVAAGTDPDHMATSILSCLVLSLAWPSVGGDRTLAAAATSSAEA
jgi:hypothetical protein